MEENKAVTETSSNENATTAHSSDGSMGMSSQSGKSEAACKGSKKDDPRSSRLKLYEKVIEKSLESFMDMSSSDRFSSMFHKVYKINPQRMENVHKQFVDELRKAIKDDIRKLNEEAGLESKLNELDTLESAAKINPDPAWRPSGVPEQDFSSFIKPLYAKQEAYLQREIKKIQGENAALAQKVQAGRERIAQTEDRISTAVTEWQASATEFERLSSSLCTADLFDL
ncbi:polyamine-modulated factor 1 [Syngnathoides biaculeatus]|uniref:polyamine-modulated factor 1 n=1 Tax=Syngnathoides biaculeatus TaxID=300417 RepID=UPI002ADD9C26|nr:polyamine-modulated factor 1 [Syngnathoides biaculeatus]